MKLKMLVAIFLLFSLTACSTSKQTDITDEVIFNGEGKQWNVKYIYNPALYDEKKVNWIEMELRDLELELSQEDLQAIDIELVGRDGVITGNVGDMVTEVTGNVILFLVGTVNVDTYKEDEYKITIKFKDQQDVIKLQIT